MKSIFRKTPLILSGVLLAGAAAAQTPDSNYVKPFSPASAYSTWSIGVGAGVLTPYSIFKGHDDFVYNGTDLGYNVYIKDQVLPSLGIQLGYTGGKVEGTGATTGAFSSYSTKLNYAVDLTGQFTLANISWMNKQNFIQPYLMTGFGIAGYVPSFTPTGGSLMTVNHTIKNGYIPAGFGFKFNISPAINIDLGYTTFFVDGDNFDGYNAGPTNDKFSYIHGGLEFALGASKSRPQLATHNPVASMRTEYLMAEQRLQMQEDAERARNAQLRSDLDAAKGDLASMRNALNQTNASLAKFTTDSDNDGVPDFLDKCPGTPAGTKVDGSGCPLTTTVVKEPSVIVVTEADKQVVKEAVKNLEFDFNKATIRPHSFPSLDRLAALLVEKGFNLKLAGYTDNVGSQAFNLKLSNERAEAVKNYLVSKNADPAKILAEGYGKEHPIASNKTAAGRQLNRRVEFTLH